MKKKICIVCPTWESGGIESFLYNILSRMDLRDLQIDIVTERMGSSVFTEALQSVGIRFLTLSGSNLRFVKNHRMFRQLLNKEQYSVLHLNAFHGMQLYYSFLAKRSGVERRILHSHNSGLRISLTRPLKLLLHRLYATAFAGTGTDLWACSGLAAKFMFPGKMLRKGYTFVPNGIDTQRFRFHPEQRERIRTELGLKDKFVIGNVGRLCSQKNQLFLLDVLENMLLKKSNCCLLLVGDGPDRERIRARADARGMGDRVFLYGVSSKVEELLCAMDVYMLPSRFEGLPISAVEAQASGLPIICNEALAKETAVLKESFFFLGLDAQKWTSTAVSAVTPDRAGAAQLLRQAGFEIAELAQMLEKEYRASAGDVQNTSSPVDYDKPLRKNL